MNISNEGIRKLSELHYVAFRVAYESDPALGKSLLKLIKEIQAEIEPEQPEPIGNRNPKVTEYVIYAQGPEHEKSCPVDTKVGMRVIHENMATRHSAYWANSLISRFRQEMPDWKFEAKEIE